MRYFRGMAAVLVGILFAATAAPLAPADPANHPTFVMISGFGLYPDLSKPGDPSAAALRNALVEIGQHRVTGIVYGTIGVAPGIQRHYDLPADFDPNAYNRMLFAEAKKDRANLWLQLRYYDNNMGSPGAPSNMTAADIVGEPSNRAAFIDKSMAAVRVYHDAFPETCTVILGEEETLYHSRTGGGMFWAGRGVWSDPREAKKGRRNAYLEQSPELDRLFIDQYVSINRSLISEIRKDFPSCKVGLHIGHEPLAQDFDGKPIYQSIVAGLPPLDFTFYDMYEKISKDDADFYAKLSARIGLLKQMGQKVYYLAQLHTTNSFGSGGGRTPSAREIDETFDLALRLGVDGFGYYTKNAIPTICMRSTMAQGYWQDPADPEHRIPTTGCNDPEDLDPLDPNMDGQKLVFENSVRRWEYGLAKLDRFAAR